MRRRPSRRRTSPRVTTEILFWALPARCMVRGSAAMLVTTRPPKLEVDPLGDGRWRVTGGAEPHLLELDLRSGALLCDCRGFTFRSRCEHVDSVTQFENGAGVDSPDPAPARPARVENAGPGLERDVPVERDVSTEPEPSPDDDDDDPAAPSADPSDVDQEPAPPPREDARTDTAPRRRRPPWVWARIVKMCAAPALTPHHKLVWLEHYSWRGGCMVSASALGRRLGQSRKTIERDRMDLRRWGLLSRHNRGVGRTQLWHLELPPRCRPQGQRITDDECETYAELLAAHVDAQAPRTTQSEVGGPHWSKTRTSDSPSPRFERDEGG